MNILPKKRWHVRTKENIARVRKDEAEAAEKEKEEQLRIENADREARINLLRQKRKNELLEAGISPAELGQVTSSAAESSHINLFEDIDHAVTARNKEHEKETKDKQEDYEKKIGYLTYLGQDTNEALKKKNWYEVLPETSRFSRSSDIKETYEKLVLKDADGKPKVKEADEINGIISWTAKQKHDPLNLFKHCSTTKIEKAVKNNRDGKNCNSEKNKYLSKKSKHCDKNSKLIKLREARLKREQQEKLKTETFLRSLNKTNTSEEKEVASKVKPKYNSQFNPELARQNYY